MKEEKKTKIKKVLKATGITLGLGAFVYLGYKYVTDDSIPVTNENPTYFEYIKGIETPEEMAALLIGYKYGRKYDSNDQELNDLLEAQTEKLLTEIPHK